MGLSGHSHLSLLLASLATHACMQQCAHSYTCARWLSSLVRHPEAWSGWHWDPHGSSAHLLCAACCLMILWPHRCGKCRDTMSLGSSSNSVNEGGAKLVDKYPNSVPPSCVPGSSAARHVLCAICLSPSPLPWPYPSSPALRLPWPPCLHVCILEDVSSIACSASLTAT